MNTLKEVISLLGNVDLRRAKIERWDEVLGSEGSEYVSEIRYEKGNMIKFRTLRRRDPELAEFGYILNDEGRPIQTSVDFYFGAETTRNGITYVASPRYAELDRILRSLEERTE